MGGAYRRPVNPLRDWRYVEIGGAHFDVDVGAKIGVGDPVVVSDSS
jgi:hypothetical protein